ncbi:hypothetical protein T265_01168 [Opisthorchis viverrini]|uniref:SET domain-containing protein n=1 Tax=Opisthorchis viverrini TaxID=6198 RepID=A0A075A3N0_OPIVI|nr:hypothetical protein T265_01168 [Opisthorchis viverrini]KER32882.1 hypothetical protein T265_01168 [Opisthorchis viverrini]
MLSHLNHHRVPFQQLLCYVMFTHFDFFMGDSREHIYNTLIKVNKQFFSQLSYPVIIGRPNVTLGWQVRTYRSANYWFISPVIGVISCFSFRHFILVFCSRILFPDGTSPSKLKLNARVNPLGAVWAKDYQEAEANTYSAAMVDYLEQRLSANLERNNRIPPSFMNRSSLCRVVLFDHDNKGLEASVRLSVNDVITEVRGEFMMLEEYEHHFDPISDYNRYVMFYQGFGDRTIVLEATRYGNSARFVRRSCIPNCRLDHTVVQGKFQLLIRASMELVPGTELTIPFDLDYRACRYPLECACARSRCPVLKWCRKLVRHKVVPNLDYSKYIESQLRVLSKPLSQESPNSRTTSFEHSGLTGSPLLRSTMGSSMSSFSNLNTSPTPSTRLRKELSDTNSPLEDDSTKSSGYRPLRASGSCDGYTTVVDENEVPHCSKVVLDSAPNQENRSNASTLLCEDADKIVFATQSPPAVNRNNT